MFCFDRFSHLEIKKQNHSHEVITLDDNPNYFLSPFFNIVVVNRLKEGIWKERKPDWLFPIDPIQSKEIRFLM